MKKKQPAFALVASKGFAPSEDAARRLIMTGQVFMQVGQGSVRVEKPGQLLRPETVLFLHGEERFVSRGAYKLLTVMEHFSLNVAGLVCLDAGASTGGFTDCLLQHGASKVYAVDVGKNQLHEKLRGESRVVSLEGVNLRTAPQELLPEQVDLIVADVSFISLTQILPACLRWLRPGGQVAALIKPQFEVEAHETIRGVVRDDTLREKAVEKVTTFARETLGLVLQGVVPSAVKGPKGNQEYLALWMLTDK